MATKDEKNSLFLNAMLRSKPIPYIKYRGKLMEKMSLVIDLALIVGEKSDGIRAMKILGSAADGLSLFDSYYHSENDSDVMIVTKNSLVYEDSCAQDSKSTWLFQLESCTMNSGYARLRLKQKGNTMLFNANVLDMTSLFIYDKTEDCFYVTNKMNHRFTSLLPKVSLTLPNIKVSDAVTDVADSGPCVTYTNNTHSKSAFGDIDIVTGIWCPEWPSVANEWILRDRFSGWPSREFIKQHISDGCYVIPVGCKECSRTHLDWRISFAHVEQKLVQNMNSEQVQCLVFLRQLKKFYFEVKMPNVITSYIIKTTMFWTIEETPPELWQPHKLLTAVKRCLNKLITFIQSDNCPHYFIRTCNLLIRRYSPVDKRDVLQTCLEARRNPMKIWCRIPQLKDLTLRQSNTKPMSSVFVDQETAEIDDGQMTNFLTSVLTHESISHMGTMFQLRLSELNSKLQVERYCMRMSREIEKFTRTNMHVRLQEPIDKFIHGITNRLIQSFKLGELSSCRNKYLEDLLCNEQDVNDINNIANICHLHMVAKNYTRCKDITKGFITAQKNQTYRKTFAIDTSKRVFPCVSRMNDHVKISFIWDLIFAQIEQDTVPTPLQTELNPISIGNPKVDILPGIKPTALVDPLVYVCFLRFWCSMKMDKNIEKLKARDDMVWCCGLANISEKAVALNLLAYCHSQLEEYEKAFAVLCRAFRQKVGNCSTLIHIAIMVNNQLKQSSAEKDANAHR